MATPLPSPNPGLLFDTLNAYQKTAALVTAIELDIFTAVAEGSTTASALAERCTASERGTRILCDALTVMGFLAKDAGNYHLTPDSAAFLNRNSPAYLGSITGFLAAPELMDLYRDMTGPVRKGGSLAGLGTIAPEHPVWMQFARDMAPMMRMPAAALADLAGDSTKKVLDIAASHGLFGIAAARKSPSAEIFAVDWAPVLEVAKENAASAGISARYHTIPGSAFEVDLGEGYDVVLVTNFLHHFNPATNEAFLKKVHAALAPGGRVLTLEFIPNEDRVSPPTQALFALIMLGSTPEGDAYTFSELNGMFTRAGFSRSELVELPPAQRVVVSYR
ncbi:MAG TPA: class I SAM-dependent methyltransferase [Bryobacteraceae bacterium]|jgi:precorrin-6B methylase 2|nr:class I SAM-dependent methyltransferase [Bryobacteraceae bacterium]